MSGINKMTEWLKSKIEQIASVDLTTANWEKEVAHTSTMTTLEKCLRHACALADEEKESKPPAQDKPHLLAVNRFGQTYCPECNTLIYAPDFEPVKTAADASLVEEVEFLLEPAINIPGPKDTWWLAKIREILARHNEILTRYTLTKCEPKPGEDGLREEITRYLNGCEKRLNGYVYALPSDIFKIIDSYPATIPCTKPESKEKQGKK